MYDNNPLYSPSEHDMVGFYKKQPYTDRPLVADLGATKWQDTTRFARADSHTKAGVICPSLVLLTHSALLADPAHFTRTESPTHTHTERLICPSLALLAVLSGDPPYFTQTESHAHRKASSARRSRCLLIQHSWQTLLISLAQNYTHTDRKASSAHRSCCSLIQHSGLS